MTFIAAALTFVAAALTFVAAALTFAADTPGVSATNLKPVGSHPALAGDTPPPP